MADPKAVLAECLLTAANVTGRKRDRLAKRFGQNRRQLLERLDLDGPVVELQSWKRLADQIAEVAKGWRSGTDG